MGAEDLLVRSEGFVRVLTINRPELRNALSRSLERRLVEEFLAVNDDPAVRCVVLTAVGEHAFCAGADLKEIAQDDREGRPLIPPLARPERTIYEVISETWKPTIAALNGVAVGAGCEMAIACDLRVATPAVQFGLPEAKRGMGAFFGSVVLPRRVPLGIALEMMFTGRFMDSAAALHWGLVNHVVDAGELEGFTLALAQEIAANAPLSVRRMKEMAVKGLTLPLAGALRLDVGPNPYTSRDRVEGIQAFLEKREPEWEGR